MAVDIKSSGEPMRRSIAFMFVLAALVTLAGCGAGGGRWDNHAGHDGPVDDFWNPVNPISPLNPSSPLSPFNL